MPPAHRVKTLIEWTPDDLKQVDAAARRLGVSRSEFIRCACREKMARKKP